jgi:SMP-30/gluconolaconase/LRE-like protein
VLNPFRQPELIKAAVFMSMPAEFRTKRRTAWSDPNRQGAEVDSFLDGPSFDRAGNLYFVDIPFGRIFRITPRGEWELVTQYDGWPNGLKVHKDGRMFIADYRRGLMVLDPGAGKAEPVLETAYSERFKGLNDLHFAFNGDLYFTDQPEAVVGYCRPEQITAELFQARAVRGRDGDVGVQVEAREMRVPGGRREHPWRVEIVPHAPNAGARARTERDAPLNRGAAEGSKTTRSPSPAARDRDRKCRRGRARWLSRCASCGERSRERGRVRRVSCRAPLGDRSRRRRECEARSRRPSRAGIACGCRCACR